SSSPDHSRESVRTTSSRRFPDANFAHPAPTVDMGLRILSIGYVVQTASERLILRICKALIGSLPSRANRRAPQPMQSSTPPSASTQTNPSFVMRELNSAMGPSMQQNPQKPLLETN